MARIITNKELKKNAIAAVMSGTLTAQAGGKCRYRQRINGKDCVCVLGATLTDEEVKETGETSHESRGINGVLQEVLDGKKIISFGFEDDSFATYLQSLHDRACGSIVSPVDQERFLKFLVAD